MRNTWLIMRREYLERVRSKAFLIFSVMTPLFVFAVTVLPAKMMSMKAAGTRQVVVLSSDQQLAEAVRQQIVSTGTSSSSESGEMSPSYRVVVSTSDDQKTRSELNAQIGERKLDGYVWLTSETPTKHRFTYVTRNASDFVETETMRSAVRAALMKTQLAAAGLTGEAAAELTKPVSVELLRSENGKTSKTNGLQAIMLPMLLMMMIYLTTLIYGIAVMRSVLQEKGSRVMEVLLSSVTAKELMAGKIIGVGAVGLTQMLLWAVLGFVAGTPAFMAARPYLKDLNVPLTTIAFFPVFFLVGYLLYSALYAAVGAIVNTEEEAQQVQWPVMLPLIACAVLGPAIIRQPSSQMAFWLSMFPLTSPIVMFVRIAVAMPPVWQIVLSLAILLVTIYAVVALCSRIYRVGILMYGKRPTLPEIVKWIKYA